MKTLRFLYKEERKLDEKREGGGRLIKQLIPDPLYLKSCVVEGLCQGFTSISDIIVSGEGGGCISQSFTFTHTHTHIKIPSAKLLRKQIPSFVYSILTYVIIIHDHFHVSKKSEKSAEVFFARLH